ncbi:MAG: bifunctional folylpolyglutamate synthase/dihydrofolate synthase [Alphaproteobacteria bacterium]|nr:bifunctional folylpolyglutamate synthase/dihydrofolate synthase [Alphaproteobacteria bacterium]
MQSRKEAEDYIYASYLEAEKYLNFSDKDALKRHPENTKDILQKLSKKPAITVTGSKGKGSVAYMIAKILQTEFNVGLMTSPHISDFCERFRFNNEQIPVEDFIKCIEKIKPHFDEIEKTLLPSEYISPIGLQAAVALTYFNNKKADINVIEHGKGAKYDDVTNIIHQYAVINTIFLEHTRELGKNLEEIAKDKVCTITDDVKIVATAEQNPEVMNIIRKQANEKKCKLLEYGKDFKTENIKFSKSGMVFDVITTQNKYKGLKIPLLGIHQAKNCALAIALCEHILSYIDVIKLKACLLQLIWPGRQEIISSEPFMMLDASINRINAESVKKSINELNISKIVSIIGIPDDKDFSGVAEVMSDISAKIILTRSSNHHYIFTEKQVDKLKQKNIEAIYTNSLPEAVNLAQKYNLPIVILGTTSLISDAKIINFSS